MTTETIDVACRSLLTLVFLVSAIGKVRNRKSFSGFVQSLRDTRLLRARVVPRVAVAVVATEFAIGMAAPWNLSAEYAFAASVVFLLVLTGGILRVQRTGASAHCNCFGVSEGPLGYRHVARNLSILAFAVTGWLVNSGVTIAAQNWDTFVLGLAAGAFLAALLINFGEIVGLFLDSPARSVPRRETHL